MVTARPESAPHGASSSSGRLVDAPLRDAPPSGPTVSEYQYYDFLALDRPLSAKDQRELRAISTRATITETRFTNSYDYGDLKADATALVARYFDAHVYLASWGTHVLAFRFPARVLSLSEARGHCPGGAARALARRGHVVVQLVSEEEASEWVDEDDGSGSLMELSPLRAEIASGDRRGLYLAWLLCVQAGDVGPSAKEPPCPPGLRTLSPALEAMVEFLRIDRHLLAAARTASDDLPPLRRADLARWVATLSPRDLTNLATGLLEGSVPGLRLETLRRFHASRAASPPRRTPRSAGQLRDAAERLRRRG
jgi:hypothetical protein